jgi:hypothetical protein
MVSVTNLMYEMILFVNYNNRQEPNGCFILLWPACRICISMRYIVLVENNQDGGAMDLGAMPVE